MSVAHEKYLLKMPVSARWVSLRSRDDSSRAVSGRFPSLGSLRVTHGGGEMRAHPAQALQHRADETHSRGDVISALGKLSDDLPLTLDFSDLLPYMPLSAGKGGIDIVRHERL